MKENSLTGTNADTFIDLLVNIITGNVIGGAVDVAKIGKSIIDIPNYRVWDNFCKFLQAGTMLDSEQTLNDDLLRRLSEILEEHGNKAENARRILYIVADMECDAAARYVGWLTQALVYKRLGFEQYFRCLKVIKNIIVEDLELLAQKMERKDYNFTLNAESTIEFVNNGLLIKQRGKLVPTNLAYDLVNCGIRWGHSDLKKPEVLPGIDVIDTSSIAYLDFGEDIVV